jgi:hypothetical protein
MVLLTYGVVLNWFGGLNDVVFHVMGVGLVSHVA